MSSDKPTGNGVIVAWVPGLENTPGWLSMSRKKQDALLEHTSRIQQNRKLKWLGEFGELMELHQVQQILEGEELKMKDYLRLLYPDRDKRTLDRKREIFEQIIVKIPPSVMKRLSAIGAEAMERFDRIANAALGDIRNAVKELPALPASTDKAAEEYLEQLDTKLLEHRQKRRKGLKLHLEEHRAANMAVNALLNYGRSCGLKTSAQWRKYFTTVVGWSMEARAVTGTLRCGRISIPRDVNIGQGRPRKHPRKEAA